MKIAIMQPYFFPYIGYFQLINAVDEFVVYDNIEYTKKGWINRNRILVNGSDSFITLPIKKDSDYLDIKERSIAESWKHERIKLLNRINGAYRKAPFFKIIYNIIGECILFEENNLHSFILESLNKVNSYLDIKTPIVISSSLKINHELKSEKKIIDICKERKSDTYINPIGGINLYRKENFDEEGIDLFFLKSEKFIYKQFENIFVPNLSIIDVMMFNEKEKIKNYLNNSYSLI
jgi:hypothetical protein